jgi:hypothetical protein
MIVKNLKGTLIKGTINKEDLLVSYCDLLEDIVTNYRVDKAMVEEYDNYETIIDFESGIFNIADVEGALSLCKQLEQSIDLAKEKGNDLRIDSDLYMEVIEAVNYELPILLGQLCPDGFYFGALPGVGSHFGFWSTNILDTKWFLVN